MIDIAEIKHLKEELEACHKAYERMADRATALQRTISQLETSSVARDEQVMSLRAALEVLQADWNAQAPRMMAVRGFLAQLDKISTAERDEREQTGKRTN